MNDKIKYCPYCGKEISIFIEKAEEAVKMQDWVKTIADSYSYIPDTVTWTPDSMSKLITDE